MVSPYPDQSICPLTPNAIPTHSETVFDITAFSIDLTFHQNGLNALAYNSHFDKFNSHVAYLSF